MQLTEKQLEIINADGHLLVTGGPGSGKTTVSIFKAAHIAARALHPGQKILFLSFARPTISRVIEAIEYEQQIPCEQKKRIAVETYHAFFWRILKAHGYLIGLPRKLLILPNRKRQLRFPKFEMAMPPSLSFPKPKELKKTQRKKLRKSD